MTTSGSCILVCSKCQTPSGAEPCCRKCGGALNKICGKCSFKNSPAKNYCDQCGTAMALAAPPPAALPGAPPAVSASTAPSDIPQTAIRRLPSANAPPKPESFQLPMAGKAAARVPVEHAASDFVQGPATNPASMTVFRNRARLHNSGTLLVLTALAALGLYRWSLYTRPEAAVPRLAAEYLQALQSGDFNRAYNMFSTAAKGHCPQSDFTAARGLTAWTWSDIKAARIEPDAAVVSYTLSVEGKEPQEDFLPFVREDGDWVRPYNWTLLQKAESALSRNDADMALLFSQAAVEINPRDPVARGYLCEAVFYRRVAAETARECALAIRLSRAYPSTLSTKSLFHLHSILGDTYKNELKRYPEALEEYNTLLSFPNLLAPQQCRLLLARSATESALGRLPESQADLSSAAKLCTEPADLEFIRSQQTPR